MADALLIVFTDEVGSTHRDCRALDESAILRPRVQLFAHQLKHMKNDGWEVLKNVGDSLVVRYDCTSDAVANAVECMFRAWRTTIRRSAKLRVAIHRPTTQFYANGAALVAGLQNLDYPTPNCRWLSFEAMRSDLFGLEMNLASRLAGIPSKNAFVICESVLADKAAREAVQAAVTRWGGMLSPRIPVTQLKGFEGYLQFDGITEAGRDARGKPLEPLWVYEILPPKTLQQNHTSLLEDSRRYQAIRMILPKFNRPKKRGSGEPVSPDRWYCEKAEAWLPLYVRSLLSPESSLAYHSDRLFRVQRSWSGPAAQLDRAAPPVAKAWLRNANKDQPAGERPNLPRYVLFSSTFGRQVDDLLRQRLRQATPLPDIPDSVDCTVELPSESEEVFERACWLRNGALVAGHAYYLVYFQFKQPAIFAPDDCDNFNAVQQSHQGLEPVCWGLLRGAVDGFVLYMGRNQNPDDDQIIRDFDSACRGKVKIDSFASLIIPLTVHRLELVWHQPQRALREIGEFKGASSWQTFIRGAQRKPVDPGGVVGVGKGRVVSEPQR